MAAPTKKVGVKGMVIHSQGREIVANVTNFMKQEAENNEPNIPLKNFKARVLAATGVSKNTYASICKEAENIRAGTSTSFSTPHKKRPRISPKSTLRNADTVTLRSIVHNFYIHEKRRPTLKGIFNKIQEHGIPFTGGISTLNKVLKKMGFKWQKTADKRKVLMETYDIRAKRIKYLRQLQRYIQEKRPIIYTDESYIHSSHTQPKEWSDGSLLGLKAPISKGNRLIMVHAGGKMGFISNALLLFRSGSKTGDYHDDMNSTNFLLWVEKQLLPNLPPRSVLVLDNASYHNVKVEKEPVFATKKAEMVEWLAARNVSFDPGLTKPELYELIKQHKTSNPQLKLDALLAAHGHAALRLPPYHPELNPIEKIWAMVKQWVAARNTTFKLTDVEALTRERFGSIGVEEWTSVCNHVDKVVEQYLQTENLLDDITEELAFVVNTGESSSDEDFDSEEDEGDDLEFSLLSDVEPLPEET